MSMLRDIQRVAYLISRGAGDAAAAKRGPTVLAKRVIRRRVTRNVYRLFR